MMVVLDFIIAIMLMISIIYTWQLNKKIVEFHSSKEEFSYLVKTLDNAILRAELGIDELKTLSNKVSIDLNGKLDKAKFFSDDLAFMTDRASILADKLEAVITEARKFEKTDFVKIYKEQIEAYRNNMSNNLISNHYEEPMDIFAKSERVEKVINEQPKLQKTAIESILARISAVQKKNKVEA